MRAKAARVHAMKGLTLLRVRTYVYIQPVHTYVLTDFSRTDAVTCSSTETGGGAGRRPGGRKTGVMGKGKAHLRGGRGPEDFGEHAPGVLGMDADVPFRTHLLFPSRKVRHACVVVCAYGGRSRALAALTSAVKRGS